MRKFLGLLSLVFSTLFIITGCGSGSHSDGHQEWRQGLLEIMSDTMTKYKSPGMVLVVDAPNLDFSFSEARGYSNPDAGELMTPDKVFRIGSNTKVFVSTVILQLVDEKRISLSDPISKYITGAPGGDEITIEHLARNVSGLFPYSDDEDFANALVADPQRQWKPEELLAYSFSHPLGFVPGSKYQYSNTNWIIQGLIIEQVTGNTLRYEVERRIIKPLRLRNTNFPFGNELLGNYSRGYAVEDSGDMLDVTDWNPSWGWAAGAMTSTMDDLTKWIHVVVDGGLISDELQYQRMNKWDPFVVSEKFTNSYYGLGIANLGGFIGHNGELPGYNTLAVYDPVEKITVLMGINIYGEASLDVLQSVVDIIQPGRKL